MPNFTVRVELHNATYQDYENLHAAMSRVGFSRQITSDDGKVYNLPTAEYDKTANSTASEICTQVKAVANSTGKSNGVLVTQAGARSWNGLEQIQQRKY